jgi:hypothetical protein
MMHTPSNAPSVRVQVPSPLAFGLSCLGALSACTAPTASTAPTSYSDAKPIIDSRCASCHRPGDIGPFSLTSYEEVKQFAGASRASIESGSMPPWQPSDDCNSYQGNFDLTSEERTTLLAWFDAGAPEGDPASAAGSRPPPEPFATDINLKLPEPYAPPAQSDDYRCQLIPWPATETRFVTGIRVKPDQRAIVHHVIVFMVGPTQAAQFRAYDDAEAGPGYTCYGGPRATTATTGLQGIDPATLLPALTKVGLTLQDVQTKNVTEAQFVALAKELGREPGGFNSLGSWVPGASPRPFPSGTGIRVEPGSMLVAQVHYNTSSSASTPDQSVIELATTTSVEREATMLAAVDLGWVSNGFIRQPMTIPAGMADVQHSTSLAFDSPFLRQARQNLRLPENAPLKLHTADHQ